MRKRLVMTQQRLAPGGTAGGTAGFSPQIGTLLHPNGRWTSKNVPIEVLLLAVGVEGLPAHDVAVRRGSSAPLTRCRRYRRDETRRPHTHGQRRRTGLSRTPS